LSEIFNILLSWQFIIFCSGFLIMKIIKYMIDHPLTNKRVVTKEIKIGKFKMLLDQLTKGFLGLTSSRKGTLCLLLFFFSLTTMTVLCLLGKLDGTAYGICLSAVTTAVVAVFCHTQSKTDQILGTPGLPPPPQQSSLTSSLIETIIGPGGNSNQINSAPVIPIVSGVDPQSPQQT